LTSLFEELTAITKIFWFQFPHLESKNSDVVDEQKLVGIVKGTEQSPTDPNKLLEWQSKDDKAKAIIGLALSDSKLHHIDLEKSSKEIWDNLNSLFGAKAMNAKFSLKLQLFRFKMSAKVTMSNHISNLRSLIRQLAEVKAIVEEEDAKAILLNNLPSKYNNVIFTLSQMSSQTLEDMIVALLAEEKRTIASDIEDDPQPEIALYSRYNCSRSAKDKGRWNVIIARKWVTQPGTVDFKPMMFSRESSRTNHM
jgi:hypothetical protein